MSKAVFQSGISRRVVESKWPTIREAFREAFRGFKADAVAYGFDNYPAAAAGTLGHALHSLTMV